MSGGGGAPDSEEVGETPKAPFDNSAGADIMEDTGDEDVVKGGKDDVVDEDTRGESDAQRSMLSSGRNGRTGGAPGHRRA